jgi:hypothetical protein
LPDDSLFVATSVTGRQIRLTESIWRKIEEHHREFAARDDYAEQIRQAIADPAYVVGGWQGASIALRWCDIAPTAPKYIAVVFRELNGDGFVITAFFISRHERLLKRGVKWQKT